MKKKFNAQFKTKVAIEAIKGQKTIAEISSLYEVHATQIARWKKQLISNSELVFSSKIQTAEKSQEDKLDKLYSQIGRLKIENDFLKKTAYAN